jgi:hypothetical protein
MSDPLRTLEDCELFLYTLAQLLFFPAALLVVLLARLLAGLL